MRHGMVRTGPASVCVAVVALVFFVLAPGYAISRDRDGGAESDSAGPEEDVSSADDNRPTPAPVTVRLSSASNSLAIQAAIAQGYFAAENLSVEHTLFKSSPTVFQDLNAGRVDMVITSADNVANYRLNAVNAVGTVVNAQIIAQHDLGLGLGIAAQPAFTTVESLRGAHIGVDQPGSGFATALDAIMRKHGLTDGVDFTAVSSGGSPARLAALEAGRYEATIVNADSIVRAKALGFSIVAKVEEVTNPYMGGALIGLESWLQANRSTVVRFLRAYHRAMGWLHDNAHRDAAVAMIVDSSTTPDLAGQIYDAAILANGLGDRFETRAFVGVLNLRNDAGGFQNPENVAFLASPESHLYDLRYYRRAVRSDEFVSH